MIPDSIKHFFNETDLKTEIVEGDIKRVIYTGENIQVILYHFPPHKVFPVHAHDKQEQMGYLVSGKMGFMVGGEERTLLAGDFYRAPIGVEHNAWTMDEPSVLLDIFAPPRKDLIK
ncbi:MAG: cupin domain-containing protein [Candidatus Latescibacteria bacterium]|nr:cupin domain-containing protein [Candidatus Latescibacterota bacterium]